MVKIVKADKNSKYFVSEAFENKKILETLEFPQRASIIPFSREAQEIQKLISTPIQLRRHGDPVF